MDRHLVPTQIRTKNIREKRQDWIGLKLTAQIQRRVVVLKNWSIQMEDVGG